MAKLKGCSAKEKIIKITRMDEALQSLEKALKGQKPGLRAQLKMITNPRPGNKTYQEVEDSSLKAGVLVLLYPWKKRLYLVLTKRTPGVLFHQGQISFPGGRQDRGESLQQTALREAREELMIEPTKIKILGELTPLYIPPSNYCMYPVVAATDRRPDFQPSSHEVAEIIEVPVDHLLDDRNISKEVWTIRGIESDVPFYFFKGHKIWGATAMVLAELIELLKRKRGRNEK
jgi:8-oxo-dGTP pyrophosphatase MutT (NUDIX family)